MKNVNFFTKCFFKNNKGLTLVEAVVAIAMIGLVSLGITTLFFSLSKTSKMSEEQLKQNAIYRVVKENVVISARKNTDILGNTGSIATGNGTSFVNLKVVDQTGKEYPEYKFNLLCNTVLSYGDTGKTVDRYKITLMNSSNDVLAEFFTEVYSK